MNPILLCSKLLQQYTTYSIDPSLLEQPQDRSMGNCALPCFQLAKEFKQAPQQIAQTIATDLAKHCDEQSPRERIEAVGPYVNFFLKSSFLAAQLFEELDDTKTSFGVLPPTGEVILIESPGPNTNKPLHLGHVRNMLLGNALKNVLIAAGHTVYPVDIVNDRGIHICKSMLAYERFGNNEQPDIKTDHYVGKRYVRYAQEEKNNPSLADDAQVMLQAREQGDDATVSLRKRMRDRALTGQQETYKRFGTTIEKTYYESDHYLKGKDIVQQGKNKGIFTTNENGHIVYNDDALGEKIVLRADGTAIYITQDIALGKIRYEDRSMDRMIYVVGNEQEDHFKFLFSIFGALGLPFAEKCHHLSYGMVALPDGKMKSREGTVIDADDIAQETHETSAAMLQERYPELSSDELERRAEIIAQGAIKFFFLKYDAVKNFVYDKDSSLRFDGETGPYIQYTYARCCSLIKKSGNNTISYTSVDTTLYSAKEEKTLLTLLNEFPEVIDHAARAYQPYLVARYLLDVASAYNSFYQNVPVLVDDDDAVRNARLALVEATRTIIKSGIALLDINVLEEM